MIGAIIGDYIGSAYEFGRNKDWDVELVTPHSSITDDTIMSLAVADAIMQGKPYAERMRYWGQKYPNPVGGYGGSFARWLMSSEPQPYNSFGNGAAMRVAAIGWAYGTLEEVLLEAHRSAMCTHDHPEGIKGAQATAAAVYLTRMGMGKEDLTAYIEQTFGYDLHRSWEELHATYEYNESCQQTVPEALICYLQSHSFEQAMRMGVSLGGDADTLLCITGAVAQARAKYDANYEPASKLAKKALATLPVELKEIYNRFTAKYC